MQHERALARNNSKRRQLSRSPNLEISDSQIPTISNNTPEADTSNDMKTPLEPITNGLVEEKINDDKMSTNSLHPSSAHTPSISLNSSPSRVLSSSQQLQEKTTPTRSPVTKVKRQAPQPDTHTDSVSVTPQRLSLSHRDKTAESPAADNMAASALTRVSDESVKLSQSAANKLKPKKSEDKPVSRRQMLRNKLYKSKSCLVRSIFFGKLSFLESWALTPLSRYVRAHSRPVDKLIRSAFQLLFRSCLLVCEELHY